MNLRFTTLAIFLSLLAWTQIPAQLKKTLPKAFKKLELGMSMEEFAAKRKGISTESLALDGFRYRWTEQMPNDKAISKVIYYFDEEEEKSLYELIIFYKDLRERDAWLAKNYGPPNDQNNTEWRFVADAGFEIQAWRYEDRLVIVAALPGTEWEKR